MGAPWGTAAESANYAMPVAPVSTFRETNGAPPHRLPDLRFRHPVRLHRPRHDHADAAVARRVRARRRAAHPGVAQVARHQGDLVRAGLHHREPSGRLRGRGAGRPRDRASQLGAHPARAAEPRRGGGRSRPRQRGDRAAHRPQGARLPLAVMGPERAHHRSPARAWLSLRLKPDGRRLLALSRAARRPGRARQAVRLRRGDRADRDADQLVARRLPAFRVRAHADRRYCRACSPRDCRWKAGSTNSATCRRRSIGAC